MVRIIWSHPAYPRWRHVDRPGCLLPWNRVHICSAKVQPRCQSFLQKSINPRVQSLIYPLEVEMPPWEGFAWVCSDRVQSIYIMICHIHFESYQAVWFNDASRGLARQSCVWRLFPCSGGGKGSRATLTGKKGRYNLWKHRSTTRCSGCSPSRRRKSHSRNVGARSITHTARFL